jgi:hypothetical protein
MGTESAELLVEEYQLAKQVLAEEMSGGSARQAARGKTLQDSLLKRRDQFIGRRIKSDPSSRRNRLALCRDAPRRGALA